MTAILVPTVLAALLSGCAQEGTETPFDPDWYQAYQIEVDLNVARTSRDDVPLIGATVVIDNDLGDRAVLTTNEYGRAALLVDWTRGPYDVTIDPGLAGQPLVSLTDLYPGDRKVGWTFDQPLDPAETVTVAGVVADHDPDTTLRVLAYGAGNAVREIDSRVGLYWLQVLADEPFDLVALDVQPDADLPQGVMQQDLSHWHLAELAPLTEHTVVNLTMGDLVAPTTEAGSFRLPSAADDPLREGARGDVTVTCEVAGAAQACGWSTWISRDDLHNRFVFLTEHVLPPETERLSTRIEAVNGAAGSRMIVPGDPDYWTEVPELMAVPGVSALDTEDAELATWSFVFADMDVPAGARWWASLEDADGETLWLVRGSDQRYLELPPPPPTRDAAALRDQVDAVRSWLRTGDDQQSTAESWSAPQLVRHL